MERDNVDDRELLKKVHETISGLDEQRLQELRNLKQHQEIKNEVLQLETKRLMNKHGEDHPRVRKTLARVAVNREIFTGLDEEVKKATIKAEPLPLNAWRVHGKVLGENRMPVSGITVFFSDVQKNWIRELGSACSDEGGYYSLTVDEKLIGAFEQKPVYLSASDKNQKLLCQRPAPYTATRGLIEYADIDLTDKTCVPPPTGPTNPRDGNTPPPKDGNTPPPKDGNTPKPKNGNTPTPKKSRE